MEANFLFWKISSQASLKQFLNFSYEKMDHVIYSPPRYTLLGISNPPTRKHILFLNKNISIIKEYYWTVMAPVMAPGSLPPLQVRRQHRAHCPYFKTKTQNY